MQKTKNLAPKAAKPVASEADASQSEGRDWSKTLFLPRTDFPMKAGLPNLEPKLLQRWEDMKLFQAMRKAAKGREKFTLHDGPPYANGNIHIGHALNKILKDMVVRSQSVMGKDSNYVPGWDCHGLPIEWKIEEQYRAKGKNKDEVPVVEFRQECREFAEGWIDVQRAEFKRLGVEGDWERPYLTMSYDAESVIAGELMKFAMNGLLYQGSKPVMWSVVERTALAEAEIEYHEHTSPTIFVKFPVRGCRKAVPQEQLAVFSEPASVVIWTTTPWTIPGNRAIAYSNSKEVAYGLYLVTQKGLPDENWLREGERLILADRLAPQVFEAARVTEYRRLTEVDPSTIAACAHPLAGKGYDFPVPLWAADFVTEDTGTGFVHIAPGHGADDYNLWTRKRDDARTIWKYALDSGQTSDPEYREFVESEWEVPHTVREDGTYFEHVPLFGGENPKRVINDKGKFADASDAVMEALIAANALVARGRLRHSYPHSWRSKAPVIFRNTPQWFIAIDKPTGKKTNKSIRELSLEAIDATRFVPQTGQNRLRGMIEARPDWVVSRQRAWGVPITVFQHEKTGEVIPGPKFKGAKELVQRIKDAFEAEGADAWFKAGARERFLTGLVDDPSEWKQVTDILDVWFDSGSTHAFLLEKRPDLGWPAALYLEGSDQHRGWFHSSLLEACGTRGRAPYDAVLTHGFILNEKGEKMAKSEGNAASPQVVTKQYGAEILRLWVASSDYSADLRFGPTIMQTAVEAYRKIRNTMRFMLGNLAHFEPSHRIAFDDMPELERYILHRLAELDGVVRKAYDAFDFKRVFSALSNFSTVELSSLYFDIRKDALYCEPFSSPKRRACLTVLDTLFECLTVWLSPILCFTTEEALLARDPDTSESVHLKTFPEVPAEWRNDALAQKWQRIWDVRGVVTGALEVERREKRIGSSLEAAPVIAIADEALFAAVQAEDWAEIAITSAATLTFGAAPGGAFTLADVPGVAVMPGLAEGRKCARSWKVLPEVGSDAEFPDLSLRDAAAVREFDARAARG